MYASSPDPALTLAFFGFFIIMTIIIYVVVAIFLGLVFKKAGIKSWKAWVPIYNTWILLEMGNQPGWWSILTVIPFVNIFASIFLYIAMYYIGMRFGKDGEFVLLGIFLPLVWLIWLAVDASVWTPNKSDATIDKSNTPPPSRQLPT